MKFTARQQTFNAKYCLKNSNCHLQYHHASPDIKSAHSNETEVNAVL